MDRKRVPWDQMKEKVIKIIKKRTQPLHIALQANDWEAIDSVSLEIVQQIRKLEFGLFIPHFLMEEFEELWNELLEKVRERVEQITGYPFFNGFNVKELYNIVTPFFQQIEKGELLSERIVSWAEEGRIKWHMWSGTAIKRAQELLGRELKQEEEDDLLHFLARKGRRRFDEDGENFVSRCYPNAQTLEGPVLEWYSQK